MKVFNCCLFNDELDMLELRLQELYDVTDHFVIVEGSQTSRHAPKPYHFLENKERFKPYLGKIISVQFDDQITPKFDDPQYLHYYEAYELQQRRAIIRGLSNARDEDMIVITDVDEILSKETSVKLHRGVAGKTRLMMQMHYYSFNCIVEGEWHLPFAIPFGTIKLNSGCWRRHILQPNEGAWSNCGWHFSFFGSNEQLRNKLSSYSESRYRDPKFTTDENLEWARQGPYDMFHRSEMKFNLVKNPILPETVKANRQKYEVLGWFHKL